MSKKEKRPLAAAAVLALLAGCGSGPGESDVRAALVTSAAHSGVAMVDPDYKEKIAKAQLIGCVKSEAGAYACDVSNAYGRVGKMRFAKTDAGWAVVN